MTDASPSGEELRSAAAHGLRWSAVSRPIIEVVQFGSIVLLARLIEPAEFGRYAIAGIAAEVAKLLVAGGLSNALVQRKTLDRAHAQAGMAIGLLAGSALTVLTLVAASLIVTPVFGARTALFVALMAPLCLVEALVTVPIATLRRRLAFRRLSELEILNTLVRVAVCVVLALAGLGGEALVLGVVAGALVPAVIAWISAPPPPPRLRRAATRELLGYAVPASLATISWVGFGNVDYAIIGARLGALQTGYYYRAYTLAVEYQGKIGLLMNQVGFPVLARASDQAEVARLYSQMIRMLTIVLFPLLVLLSIAAPVAVPFIFGSHWAPAVVPTQILALGGASMIIFNGVGTVFMATGRVRAMLVYGWAQFIMYGLAVFLVAPLGLTAVAIAAAIVHALFAIIVYALMLRGSSERPMRRLWSDIAPATVSCLGLVAVALPVSLVLTAAQLPAVLWLAALGLVAVPPYLLTLRTCFPATWRAQCTALERILPGHRRLSGVKRRLAAAAVAH
jgi:lipopolysaccharide exporter